MEKREWLANWSNALKPKLNSIDMAPFLGGV